MNLKYKVLKQGAKGPKKAGDEDACYDLYVHNFGLSEDFDSAYEYILNPGQSVKCYTGISIELPKPYWLPRLFGFHCTAGFIWDRSSLGVKGIHRLAGVIDYGYRGEIIVCLTNLGKTWVSLKSGDRVGQLFLSYVLKCGVEEVDELSSADRGDKGFGSTGR